MGQQVSKDIRSRLEHQTLEELLINDKYIEELEQHLPSLPATSHHNLTKILASWEKALLKHGISRSESNQPRKGLVSSVKDKNSWSSKLGSLWSIQSQDINIPQNAANVLKQDPRSLLRPPSKGSVDLQSPSDYYEYTCKVETDRILCKLLWRFLTTFYYDLISKLDATRNLLSKTENGGIAFVVAVICQSGKHNGDIVREKVIGWAKIGRRYRGFMDALCSGCLFLFPEKISDLVWETYVPVKGSTFGKVTNFLRELGIVRKCEEEGWNDLSDQILLILHEPFRSIIPFQYQPHQQPRLTCASNPSPATVPGGDELHSHEDAILSHGGIQYIQDIGVNRSFSCSALDSSTLSRPTPNRVTKTKRKANTASARRHWTKNLTAPHQARRPEKSPRVVHQSHHASASRGSLSLNVSSGGTDSAQYMPNETPGCDLRLLSPACQHVDRHLDRGQRADSNSNALRPERTGFGTISAVLNHDSNMPAPPQGSLEGSSDQQRDVTRSRAGRNLLPAIRIDKSTVHQIVVKRPHDILGGIWFGSPQGYPPCVLLRLPRALDTTVKPSGTVVDVPGPSPDARSTVKKIYLIKLECFKEIIQRDGFGKIFWNECGEDAFVTMEVIDTGLVEDLIRAAVPESDPY